MNKTRLILFTPFRNWKLLTGFTIFSMCFVFCYNNFAEEEAKMKTLKVRWQRLVDEKGQTCQRCGSTEKEVQKAILILTQSLAPLEIQVILEKKALDPATCAKDISQSNRIWIGGRALEKWLGAEVGQSPCATCCPKLGSKVECRTVKVGEQTYEEIPASLIIKAGLLAASQLVEAGLKEPGCEKETSPESQPRSCCPKSQ